MEENGARPDFIASNLLEAAEIIEKEEGGKDGNFLGYSGYKRDKKMA